MLHAVRLSMFLNVRLCHYRLLFWIVSGLMFLLTPHRFLGLGFAVHTKPELVLYHTALRISRDIQFRVKVLPS